jgi:transposase
MEILIENACGLDVHKDTAVACIMGNQIKKEVRTFRTTTGNLLELKKWLSSNDITHIAMESTGVYWKPIFNILEKSFKVVLVNACHIKNVPGRKTDVKDCEWICKLLRSGLLNASFIPPEDIRDLRDLVRYRRKLHEDITKEKNRVQKILEDANIKLSGVVTDIFGVTGTRIITRMLEGETDPTILCELAKGKLKDKKLEIREAVAGNMREHHKFMIQSFFDHIKNIEEIIEKINREIDEKLKPYFEEYELLQTIPGVKSETAASIIAEIGVNMDQYPTADHLSSWAGMSPGNNESAGKKKAERQQTEIKI